MDTRTIYDQVRVQMQHHVVLRKVATQTPYPPRILHAIAGLYDAAHIHRHRRRRVIIPN
jgi:hypothetical protein